MWFRRNKKNKEEVTEEVVSEVEEVEETEDEASEVGDSAELTSDESEDSSENEFTSELEDDSRDVTVNEEELENAETSIVADDAITSDETEIYDINEVITDEAANDVEENGKESEEVAEVEEAPKKGFFTKLKDGLAKTKNNMVAGVEQVFSSFKTIDEDFYEELEEALIIADIGVQTSMQIIEDLRVKVKEKRISDPVDVRQLLKDEIEEIMTSDESVYDFIDKKSVVLIIGVNGVGKTTTIGKLSNQFKNRGKKVLLAAGDTFRAAAIEQLTEWANRADVEIVAAKESTDPGAVVFDAVQAAKARNTDLLICDTAGRLHNKKNLMEELRKISKIIDREYEGANKEVLLVLDSTTGQNALQQAKQFKEIADINGIVLTKLDGTAKGGIAIAIQNELNLPVKYIGVGEGINDLQKFNAKDFVDALFD